MQHRILVLLASLIICAGASAQTTHIVDANGGGDFLTIGEAVTAAASGDRIEVWAATYNEAVALDGKDLELVGDGSGLTFIESAGDGVVVDGAGASTISGLSIGADGIGLIATTDTLVVNDVVFDGTGRPTSAYAFHVSLTSDWQLTGSEVTGYFSDANPIGVVDQVADFTWTSNDFHDNSTITGAALLFLGGLTAGTVSNDAYTANLDGDALISITDAEVAFENCDFVGNTATAVAVHDGTLDVLRCDFTYNESVYGPAIDATSGSALSVDGCTFEENVASGLGGAVHVADSAVEIQWSHFISNVSQQYGGAVAIEDPLGQASIHHNRIVDNGAPGLLQGGGLYINGGAFDAANNVIVGNTAGANGGGMYLYNTHGRVSHSTFAGNGALVGGGITSTGGTVELVDNIVAHGTQGYGIEGDANVTVRYCDVYDNPAGDYDVGIGDQTGIYGNISEDPLFVDYTQDGDFLNDDVHLQTLSPCVDAGDPDPDNDGDDCSIDTDDQEEDGSCPDLGAYGGTDPLFADQDRDNVSVEDGDCDDTNPDTYLGAPEICDRQDNDCDGVVPSDEFDTDGDGMTECEGDCDDTIQQVFTGAPERCDGLDNDCDGIVPADEVDGDGDGSRLCDNDCDDADPDRFPTNPEICDGIDNDCDETLLQGEDEDLDGDGSPTCADCDDYDEDRFPGNPEICDGLDNDCDEVLPADEEDADFDGASICEGDCDDSDPYLNMQDQDNDDWDTCMGDCEDGITSINPGAEEVCNGWDDNCDGELLIEDGEEVEVDMDLDGFMVCDNDCDDMNASRFPGNVEICDGVDNDCDTELGAAEADDDGDGYTECTDGYTTFEGDCDDLDPAINPGADELCNEIDDNCDGITDENPDCYQPEYSVSGGGGCQLGGDDTRGPAWPMLLALLALMGMGIKRLRRAASFFLVIVMFGVGVRTPLPAQAQESPAIELHGVRANGDGLGLYSVDSAEVLGLWHPGFGIQFGYSRNPLLMQLADNPLYPQDKLEYSLVGSVVTMDLNGAIGFGVADVAVSLPIHFSRTGEGAYDWESLTGGGVGDLRVTPKVTIFNPGRRTTPISTGPLYSYGLAYGLAVGLPLTFPMSNASSGVGDPSVRVEPTVIGEFRLGPLQTLLNLGPKLRSEPMAMNLIDLNVQHEFQLRWGLAFRPLEQVQIGGQILFATGGEGGGTGPAEIFGGARIYPGKGLQIDIGGGRGFTEGYGTPDLRLMAGVSFVKPRQYEAIQVKDTDGDGLTDNVDACRNDAEDVDGWEDDDGCPDKDNDGDTFLDAEDQCPDEAENFNANKDDDGCPDEDPDKDGDGLTDRDDPCPADAETLNGVDDFDGCPEESLAMVTGEWSRISVSKPITFASGKADPEDEGKAVVAAVARILREYPQIASMEIQAHTDDKGSEKSNLAISQKRADAIARLLIDAGVAMDRLEPKGLGESAPILPDTSEAARTVNRRVEFHILTMTEVPQPVVGLNVETGEEEAPVEDETQSQELSEEERKKQERLIRKAERKRERQQDDSVQAQWETGEDEEAPAQEAAPTWDTPAEQPPVEEPPPAEEEPPPAEEEKPPAEEEPPPAEEEKPAEEEDDYDPWQ